MSNEVHQFIPGCITEDSIVDVRVLDLHGLVLVLTVGNQQYSRFRAGRLKCFLNGTQQGVIEDKANNQQVQYRYARNAKQKLNIGVPAKIWTPKRLTFLKLTKGFVLSKVRYRYRIGNPNFQARSLRTSIGKKCQAKPCCNLTTSVADSN